MSIKAVLVDDYGTLFLNDAAPMVDLCRQIGDTTAVPLQQDSIARQLWDACNIRYKAWYGRKFISYRDLIHDAVAEIADACGSHSDPLLLAQNYADSMAAATLYQDAKHFCEGAPVRVVMTTQSGRKDAEAMLRNTSVDTIEIFSSDDAKAYKPRQDFFTKAAKKLQLQPGEIVYIGDSLVYDIKPAAKAGMKTVWVNRRRRAKDKTVHPDMIATDLNQALEALCKLIEMNQDEGNE